MAKLAKIFATSGRDKGHFAAQDDLHGAKMGQIFAASRRNWGRFAAQKRLPRNINEGAYGPLMAASRPIY